MGKTRFTEEQIIQVLVLDRLANERGLPEVLVVDNGPEFTGKDLNLWA